MDKQALEVLLVNASARDEGSVTRRFAGELVTALQQEHGAANIKERDVAKGMPYIDEQWINANFTAADQRSADNKFALSYSDNLVAEVQQSDIIVIATPVYNFSVPASLKAWIDQICRVGLTFNYTENGPVGKLQGKKVYIVMATGGTQIGSDIDFASSYLHHVLGFIGIDDVSIISAERFNAEDEQAINNIRNQIKDAAQQAA